MPILRKVHRPLLFTLLLAFCSWAIAGKLSIVIDDFGYQPHNENRILAMPTAISIAVLPNAPHARDMALKAHQQRREILIHLPMAPIGKQPLEKDTLRPEMSSEEIAHIIRQAVNSVPYAVGLNNHMGSAMTYSLLGMQKVMQALNAYQFYFLDSMTIGSSQSISASAGTQVKVIKRKVFLDDTQNEADIRVQFNRAVQLARRTGSAIAIGHPHPATIKVLQQMLPSLDADIVLVRPSQLLNEPVHYRQLPYEPSPAQPARKPQLCAIKQPLPPVGNDVFFKLILESLRDSAAAHYIEQRWRTWVTPRRR
ncbi:MAG: divergent polysaccharide deacetylase family protein [Candidatus Malihini olakiniferum]